MANCAVKVTANGIMVQKEHKDSPRKIDLAVASIMAFDRATRARERAPSTSCGWAEKSAPRRIQRTNQRDRLLALGGGSYAAAVPGLC